jgi:hypothetical protein
MKSTFVAALLLAFPLVAQDDTVFLISGSKVEGVKVTSFTVRDLKYTKGGSTDTVPTDQVMKVELGKFKDVFRLGLRDADLMITKTREQVEEKNQLLAQAGFVAAANLFFDAGNASTAVGCLDELQKVYPEAGTIPEMYRMKFEYYMSQGQKGAKSAQAVATKFQNEATGGAWPAGFVTESEFFLAMAERQGGLPPKEFQVKLRNVLAKAMGNNQMVANRANIELAHSLRENKDPAGARKIYEELAKKDGVDASSRGGAFLGLGHIALEEGGASNPDSYRKALLLFLRVHLETRDAWPSLHAEAMYYAAIAAEKWKGNDFEYIRGRCRAVLNNEYGGSEWAERARAGR